MISYADSGFIVSLYKKETTSPEAMTALSQTELPVVLSLLTQLEVRNAFHLARFRRQIAEAERALKWQRFQEDVQAGVFELRIVDHAELYEKAGALADRYSANEGTRSLDLLHLAAAQLLGAGELLSFDARQRKAARAEGMKVRPR